MESSLRFLYNRLKNNELSKEQLESKVCQEILIAKIGNDQEIKTKVSFKGGLIIDALAKGKRGYTKDIDFDLVKYPLSDNGINDFFSRLNNHDPYSNIIINVVGINELRHKNYQGKRVVLNFSDGESSFVLTVDIGVYFPLLKKNTILEYNVVFGNKTSINVNPVERIIAEKLSTFAIYLTDNTRVKDLYDAYYLVNNIQHNKDIVFKMLKVILVTKGHFYKNIDLAISSIEKTLHDKKYQFIIEKDQHNWVGSNSLDVINSIIDYLNKLSNSSTND